MPDRSIPPPGDMPPEELRRVGRELIDWIADYFDGQERLPVAPRCSPGELIDAMPQQGPVRGEPAERILDDFDRLIVPHVVHWSHPGFLAYFAAGGSAPGALAESLIAALNNVGLLWKASPALVELEEVALGWLADWLALPRDWFGIIHSTASDASFHAVIAARQAAVEADRDAGLETSLDRLTIYASEQAHMSIEKTMLALGRGREACRKIEVNDAFQMKPTALDAAIRADLEAGLRPIAVVATVGTTSTSSVDPIPALAEIAARHGLWLHVDAAYAGPAAMLEEKRDLFAGCELADSFLLNPHKWLFCPMDVTAFYTAKPDVFRRALGMTPEYLRSQEDPRAKSLAEYSIPLGRRFRGLKLWFVLRYFGRDGLKARLREHIRLAQGLAQRIKQRPDFELMAPTPFSLVCFRYRPAGADDKTCDGLNEGLLQAINRSGEFYLSHTKLRGRYTIRVAIGNLRTAQRHIDRLWELVLELTEIKETAND